MAGQKDFMPVNAAADQVGVSTAHIYSLIQAGHLVAIDVSVSGGSGRGSIRVSRGSVKKFLSSRQIDPEKYFA